MSRRQSRHVGFERSATQLREHEPTSSHTSSPCEEKWSGRLTYSHSNLAISALLRGHVETTGIEPAPPIHLQTQGYDPELSANAWALLPCELRPLVSHNAGTKRRVAVVDLTPTSAFTLTSVTASHDSGCSIPNAAIATTIVLATAGASSAASPTVFQGWFSHERSHPLYSVEDLSRSSAADNYPISF